MSETFVTRGQSVNSRDLIGSIGRPGNLAGTSYPTHVHVAIWRPLQNGMRGFVQPWAFKINTNSKYW